jgi:HAD superfamily hydrolase (TIGR01509 family)
MFAHAISPFTRPLSDEQWRAELGGPPERILERVLGNKAVAQQAMVRLADYERAQLQEVAAFPGMKSLLGALRSVGVSLGVWTGRDRISTQKLMDEHGLGELLTAWTCGDDLPSHKPDPAGLLAVLEALKLRPSDALFVGDSECDVLAGAAVGVKTVWITHGLQVNPMVERDAWRVVSSPANAYGIIRANLIS